MPPKVETPETMADRIAEQIDAEASGLRRQAEVLVKQAEALEKAAQMAWHEGYSWTQRQPKDTDPADRTEDS